MTDGDDLAEGARNLLLNCAGIGPGQDILIVHEDPALGWYDLDAPQAVAAQARALGATPSLIQVSGPENGKAEGLEAKIALADATIFFARIGDQDRFSTEHAGQTRVVSYARSGQALASGYGRTDHSALRDLKVAIDEVLLGADWIEISCPLGTALSGRPTRGPNSQSDVTVRRFPLGVAQPVLADGFSGRAALARYLTPSGSRVYHPANVEIDDIAFAEVENGRIVDFSGPPATTRRIWDHYEAVAGTFGIDSRAVHSWHAGFHPFCEYDGRAAADPDRWSNTIFNCPRFLHFHTCGGYAPGEICWMVLDPTITVDGRSLWDAGLFRIDSFDETRRCADRWQALSGVYDAPVTRIGLDF